MKLGIGVVILVRKPVYGDRKTKYIEDIKLSITVRHDDEEEQQQQQQQQIEVRIKIWRSRREEERLSREQSERKIAEIFSPETVQFILRRSTRNRRRPDRYSGGRIPSSAVDTVNIVNPNVIVPFGQPGPSVIVPSPNIKPHPSVIVPSPNIKPDPSVIVPSPDIKPKIDVEVLSNDASGREIKPIVKSYSDEDINRGADALIQLGLDIRNSIILLIY